MNQEVKATGAMTALESLVNSIKGLRFKVVKLSTYNSLVSQSKLKDEIISHGSQKQQNQAHTIGGLHDRISKLLGDIQSEKLLVNELQTTFANRTGEKIELQRMNDTQANTIKQLYKELAKYKGQRNSKGHFIKKENYK